MSEPLITVSYEPSFGGGRDGDLRLATAFFLQFARFECAMKGAGYLKENSKNDASPDWDELFKETAVRKCFETPQSSELEKAIDFYIATPSDTRDEGRPKKQIVDSSRKLSFEDKPVSGCISCQLSVYVRRTRNNLFHGGKFGTNTPIQFRHRDRLLMKYGLIILNACLHANADLAKHYSGNSNFYG